MILYAIHTYIMQWDSMHAVPTTREHIVQPHRPNPGTATKLTSPTHLRPSDSLTNSSPWELATTPREVGGQAVLGRQPTQTTPWLTERHG